MKSRCACPFRDRREASSCGPTTCDAGTALTTNKSKTKKIQNWKNHANPPSRFLPLPPLLIAHVGSFITFVPPPNGVNETKRARSDSHKTMGPPGTPSLSTSSKTWDPSGQNSFRPRRKVHRTERKTINSNMLTLFAASVALRAEPFQKSSCNWSGHTFTQLRDGELFTLPALCLRSAACNTIHVYPQTWLVMTNLARDAQSRWRQWNSRTCRSVPSRSRWTALGYWTMRLRIAFGTYARSPWLPPERCRPMARTPDFLRVRNVEQVELPQHTSRCCVRNTKIVRGSFSAKVPRSSFARVRRVLVPHMEEEGEDQEKEKEDEREDGKQRIQGRVLENQNNHIMSAWGWDEMKCATHTKLEPMSMWH